jgi:hydroxymethylpyrimidine/phosphomethylpyrimidine kinase
VSRTHSPRTPRALTIAGSDSGGGAGIQADLKAFASCGVHGTSAITAITAQNTLGVSAIHPIPPEIILAQVRAVVADIGVDAVKVGMLASAEIVHAVARALDELPAGTPVVVDPVMVAESGAQLLDPDAQGALLTEILPRACVLTPNVPEARALARHAASAQPDSVASPAATPTRAVLVVDDGEEASGLDTEVGEDADAGASSANPEVGEDTDMGASSANPEVGEDTDMGASSANPEVGEDTDMGASSANPEVGENTDMEALARTVLALGPQVVVLTGGHRAEVIDLFVDRTDPERVVSIPGERHPDGAAHGSGCTHSSLLAAALALGNDPLQAAFLARALAGAAVAAGLRDVGQGTGPVDVIGLSRLRAL